MENYAQRSTATEASPQPTSFGLRARPLQLVSGALDVRANGLSRAAARQGLPLAGPLSGEGEGRRLLNQQLVHVPLAILVALGPVLLLLGVDVQVDKLWFGAAEALRELDHPRAGDPQPLAPPKECGIRRETGRLIGAQTCSCRHSAKRFWVGPPDPSALQSEIFSRRGEDEVDATSTGCSPRRRLRRRA